MEDQNSTSAEVTASIFNLPIGTVMPFMGTAEAMTALEAQGWLPCNGRSFPINEKKALHDVIKNSHGGDTSHFNLPDLRGVFLRGVDRDDNSRDPNKGARVAANGGGNTGNAVGTYQDEQFKKHSHKTKVYVTNPGFKITHHDDNWHPPVDLKEVGTEPQSEGGDETRPKNISTYYIIFSGLPAK